MEQFSEEQVQLLKQDLDPRFVSQRKGGGNTNLKYIEGHDAIDQANRLFGYGNWSYRPLSCVQTVLIDPITGEAVGVAYKAQVELIVRGCVAPVVDVGSQPVATWNIEDPIWKARQYAAKNSKKPVDESPFTPFEKAKARGQIIDAHEMAEKGAVTDALKRALRTFGNQFGNGLYGDGPVVIADNSSDSQENTAKRISRQKLNDLYARGKKLQLFASTSEFTTYVKESLDLDAPIEPRLLTEEQAQDLEAQIINRERQAAPAAS